MIMVTFIAIPLVCGVFVVQTTAADTASNPSKCKATVSKTIKIMRESEMVKFKGKTMLKALQTYENGISESEYETFDQDMGPFDDQYKNIKKLFRNLEIIREDCRPKP